MRAITEGILVILAGALLVFLIIAAIAGTIGIFSVSMMLLDSLNWTEFWKVVGSVGVTMLLVSAGSSTVNK